MTSNDVVFPARYGEMLEALTAEEKSAQYRAQRVVNTQLVQLYWRIGNRILSLQEQEGWRTGIIKRFADDLRSEFPSMKGFSASNLEYVRAFDAAWPDEDSICHLLGNCPGDTFCFLLTGR